MCTATLANTIVEVLDEMVKEGKVFTAYDVTLAVRAKTDDTVLHDDVRNIVGNGVITASSQNKAIGDYNKELCTLNVLGNPQALVYFPDGKLASDHTLVSSSASAVSTAPAVSTASAVDLDDDEHKVTNEGRVNIPRKLTAQVTPNGGTYDVLINGTLKCMSKDARGTIRIGLKQFGIRDSKIKITADTTNNTINIETV